MKRMGELFGAKRKVMRDYNIIRDEGRCCDDRREKRLNMPFECTVC